MDSPRRSVSHLLFSGIATEPWWGSRTRYLHSDFGWLNPPAPPKQYPVGWAPAPPAPFFQLPRLAECLRSLPTAVANLRMPGVHTRANKPSGGLAQRKHVRSTTQPARTETPARDRVGHLGQSRRPRRSISNVPTSAQKHESASKHGLPQRGREVGPAPPSQMLSAFLSLPSTGRGARWANAN